MELRPIKASYRAPLFPREAIAVKQPLAEAGGVEGVAALQRFEVLRWMSHLKGQIEYYHWTIQQKLTCCRWVGSGLFKWGVDRNWSQDPR